MRSCTDIVIKAAPCRPRFPVAAPGRVIYATVTTFVGRVAKCAMRYEIRKVT